MSSKPTSKCADKRHKRRAKKREKQAAVWKEVLDGKEGCTCSEKLEEMAWNLRSLVWSRIAERIDIQHNCLLHGEVKLSAIYEDSDRMMIARAFNDHILAWVYW